MDINIKVPMQEILYGHFALDDYSFRVENFVIGIKLQFTNHPVSRVKIPPTVFANDLKLYSPIKKLLLFLFFM